MTPDAHPACRNVSASLQRIVSWPAPAFGALWRRAVTAAFLCLGLASCGGGGSSDTPSAAIGVLKVTVSDAFGARIPAARVAATLSGSTAEATTDADGVALVGFQGVFGTASVTVSRDTFVTETLPAAVSPSAVSEVAVTLDRATAPAGGSLGSRSGRLPIVGGGGQRLTFEIEVVVVDGNSNPVTGLTPANFVLRTCAPNLANDKVDCVRGASAAFDAPYTPTSPNPIAFTVVPANPVQPFAAGLMLDQSGSIATSDPTGARLYSAKAFLTKLGAEDRVLLSAFANEDAKIPEIPLTVYPPVRSAGTLSSDPSYFAILDSLAGLVGGYTPLYDAVDLLRQQLVSDASLPAGIGKAAVVFTDGDDTTCGDALACRTRRQASIDAARAQGFRIFTIGLSGVVNFEALGELSNTTGGAFLFAESAEQLVPLYGSVGKLLSLGLPTYRLSWTVEADSTSAFQTGNALIGRIELNAGGSPITVPFMVGVP